MPINAHSIWGCPFCPWTCPSARGGFDYGLIEAHMHEFHREVGDGLFPHDLLALTRRTHFQCPLEHANNKPWVVSWASDGTAVDAPDENPYWCGDADIGLVIIAQHMEAVHPEVVYRQWGVEGAPEGLIPIQRLNAIRRVGVRGSPGVRIEG